MEFSAKDYSKLKHGSGLTARAFGYELARSFFNAHSAKLLTSQILVMESSYSFVKNAASLMTDHFIDRLNVFIAEMNGYKCQRMRVHRSLPYISDYGKLDEKSRLQLLDSDKFSFDETYTKDKLLVFIDDVIITGCHEKKILEMLAKYNSPIDNAYFVYYAEFTGAGHPEIESYLNNKTVFNLDGLLDVLNEQGSELIVRPLKMMLGWPDTTEYKEFLSKLSFDMISKSYLSSIGEGYFQNPAYSMNFSILRNRYYKIFHEL